MTTMLGYDHEGHDEGTSLELNAQALKNLGLTQEYLQPIVPRDYKRHHYRAGDCRC